MGVCSQEHLPKWERLSDDYVREETRKESRSDKQVGGGDENLALVSKTKKGKRKVFVKKGDSHAEGQQSG
jgi:hypothetical protein